MKALIVLLIALAACTQYEEMPEFEEDVKILQFLKGFLEGLGEKGNLEELKKCVKGADNIIDNIIKAIKLIATKKLESIIEGVKLLVESVRELLDMIKPCMESFKELKKLYEALKKIDFKKIGMKILTRFPEFLGYITKAIECLTKTKDWACGGKNIGSLLRRLLLELSEEDEDPNPIVEFFKGFLKGLNESGNIEELMKCVKNVEEVINEIIAAIKIIQKGGMYIMEGLAKLFAAVTKLINMIQPCVKGFEQIKKLIEALGHIDIMKILMKIMINLSYFMNLIKEIIAAFTDKRMYDAGLGIGTLLYKLFLVSSAEDDWEMPDNFNFDDFVNILKGILKGIDQNGILSNTYECIDHIPAIVQKFKDLIEYIKQMKWETIEELADAMVKMLEMVKEVLKSTIPCSKCPAEIIGLIKKIISITAQKLLEHFLKHIGSILADITQAVGHIKGAKYFEFGSDIGDVLFVLLLGDDF